MAFMAGTFVLDARARAAIGGFLSRFGQLLEPHHGGETLYAFNCTNVVEVLASVDEDAPAASCGAVILEAFDEAKVPEAASVFKDPSTAAIRVYANDAAKEAIERWSVGCGSFRHRGRARRATLKLRPILPAEAQVAAQRSVESERRSNPRR